MKSDCKRMVNVLFKPISRSISKRDFGKLYHNDALGAMLYIEKGNIGFKYVVKEKRIIFVLK